MEDDGGDTTGVVDGPAAAGDGETAADGGAAAAAAAEPPAADGTRALELPPTELPTGDAVLERAGTYAPTSIPADAFGAAP